MKTALLALLLFAFPSNIVAETVPVADPIPSLFGYKLGMHINDVKLIRPIGTEAEVELPGNHYYFSDEISSIPFDISVTFIDERLEHVWAKFPSEHFSKISTALNDKYGEGKQSISILQTGMGAQYEQVKLNWKYPGIDIDIQKYVQTINDGCVSMTSDKYMDLISKQRAKQKEELKKGL